MCPAVGAERRRRDSGWTSWRVGGGGRGMSGISLGGAKETGVGGAKAIDQ